MAKSKFDVAANLTKFLAWSPKRRDREKFEIVECKDGMWRFGEKEFENMFAKMAFLCKEKLVVDVKVVISDSEKERNGFGHCPARTFGATVVTTTRMKRIFHWNGFVIRNKETDGDIIRYTATRMPRVKWDGKTELWKYPINTIVTIPYLTHYQWENYWYRVEEKGKKDKAWWNRVHYLRDNFKIWLFQPVWYCKACRHQHQGAHRLMVAKLLRFKTINALIMNHYWPMKRKDIKRARRLVDESKAS